ncbi:P22 phage major capsid protein family protein [Mesorhizobium wenxiniae]|uniref:Capsid protein n=1 Tax=Mesorhizobium wenxiniae TaxID=2014805 RepID=A0A271KE81_9HYPH|nr:P22 phage major capsid protein family protein [Mesorhizobium wenxiniae]PAP93996.1 hypothetical protein CIT31_16650 [Mesorhizobium wenxiniae]
MSNTTLTADIIAKEAVMILENELVMGNLVYRGYEDEFSKNINGYKVGETVSIRRPTDFTVRDGKVAAIQDVVEGKIPVTVDKQKGVDFKFSSQDLTLQIKQLSERVIKPAMIQLANQIDRDLMAEYKNIPGNVTIPSGGINSFADFALAPEYMDKTSVPQEDRYAVLSPADHWAMLGSSTALYMQDVAKDAFRKARIGRVGNVDTYMSQNVPTHTTGDRTGTDLIDLTIVDGTFTWASVKDSTSITIHMDGYAGATSTIKYGDTFTISDVYDVNPVTKETLGHLKKFVVMADAVGSGNESDVLIWPPIILSGAQKTCHLSTGTDINDNTVTWQGVASTGYVQNLFFHKNAFALTMVPLVSPPGAIDVARRTFKGVSVRVIPYYDGTNDDSNWRLDVLYGTDTIDPRLAVRASLAADI